MILEGQIQPIAEGGFRLVVTITGHDSVYSASTVLESTTWEDAKVESDAKLTALGDSLFVTRMRKNPDKRA